MGGSREEDRGFCRGSLGAPGLLFRRLVATTCAPGPGALPPPGASTLAPGKPLALLPSSASWLLVGPARALLETRRRLRTSGPTLIVILIAPRGAWPSPYRPSPAHPASGRVRLRAGVYQLLGASAAAKTRRAEPGSGAARRALAGSLPAGNWACAARGRFSGRAGERACGSRLSRQRRRASGLAEREAGAELAPGDRFSLGRAPTAGTGRERSGSGAFSRPPPGEGSRRLRGKPRPRGRIRGKSPSEKGAYRGPAARGFFRRFSKPAFVCRDGAVPGAASAFVHS